MSKKHKNKKNKGVTIIVNGNINITINGIANDAQVSIAKDKLVELIYNKRGVASWGGFDAWSERLELYMTKQYFSLYGNILALKDSVAKDKALGYLTTIISGTTNK